MSTSALDPLIHNPQRLRIVATLATLPDGDTLPVGRLQTMIGLRRAEPLRGHTAAPAPGSRAATSAVTSVAFHQARQQARATRGNRRRTRDRRSLRSVARPRTSSHGAAHGA